MKLRKTFKLVGRKQCTLAICSLAFLLGSGCSGAAESDSQVADRPNIVVIVADQMRRPAMGFWSKPEYAGALNGVSDPVKTPHLDALAAEGVVFTQAIANFPLCSPFRGMLLSGLYPHKNGVNNNTRKDRTDSLREDVDTLPEVLRDSGYATALVGKAHWHVNRPVFDENGDYQGTESSPGGHYLAETDYDTYIPPGPGRQGFDYWYQSISHNHQNPLIYSNDPSAIDGKADGVQHRKGVYSSVDQANQIIEYLQTENSKRDVNSPFFVLWTLDPPHSPYESIADTDAEIFREFYEDAAIGDLLNRPNADPNIGAKFIRYYLSMVTLIDREIGRVVASLKEQGLYENTIIVFTSDHGELMGSHGDTGKNKVFEESLGIPLIVSFPEKLSHRVESALLGIPDIMPTLLGLAELESKTPQYLDGENLAPLLLDPDSASDLRRKSSFYYGPKGQLGVRTERYTYAIERDGALLALFDNVKDPYQLSPLKLKGLPDVDRAFLRKELGSWICGTDHPWSKNRPYTKKIDYEVDACSAEIGDSLSADFNKSDVHAAMKKVADWQLERFNPETNLFEGYDDGAHMAPTDGDSHPQGWVYAAFHVGMSRWAQLAAENGDNQYLEWQYNVAKRNKYLFSPRIYNADDYAIGQLYLDLYETYKEPEMLVPLRVIFELILNTPSTIDLHYDFVTQESEQTKKPFKDSYGGREFTIAPCKNRWCWADALFMGPPVWVHLARVSGDDRYLEFADSELWATVDLLWDKDDHLFFRDSRFFDRREENGEKVIWARGVGWVAAGLARILEQLPKDHFRRPQYEQIFAQMMSRLSAAQQDDGLWRPSVLAPESKPFKETSGTALIAFALASGINQGILGRAEYLPVVEKAWGALIDAVQPSGKLGWVQQIGEAPDNVSAEDSQLYAVGGFFLVGTEVYKLSAQ